MIYRTLPRVHTHRKLFFDYLNQGEFLGLAMINKNLLYFDTIEHMKREIHNFFTLGLHSDLDLNIITEKNYTEYKSQYKIIPIENYAKLVWLSHDFILKKSFKNPIGVHWDPTMNKWRIHPGGSRQKIIHLFHRGPIKVLAFNTGGTSLKFSKIFSNFEELQNYFKDSSDLNMCVVADHGSLIPHIHFDNKKTIIDNVKKYFERLKKFFTQHKLEANFDLNEYGYIAPKKFKKIVRIKINNTDDQDQQIRSLCLVSNFQNFKAYEIRIECA